MNLAGLKISFMSLSKKYFPYIMCHTENSEAGQYCQVLLLCSLSVWLLRTCRKHLRTCLNLALLSKAQYINPLARRQWGNQDIHNFNLKYSLCCSHDKLLLSIIKHLTFSIACFHYVEHTVCYHINCHCKESNAKIMCFNSCFNNSLKQEDQFYKVLVQALAYSSVTLLDRQRQPSTTIGMVSLF